MVDAHRPTRREAKRLASAVAAELLTQDRDEVLRQAGTGVTYLEPRRGDEPGVEYLVLLCAGGRAGRAGLRVVVRPNLDFEAWAAQARGRERLLRRLSGWRMLYPASAGASFDRAEPRSR